MSTVKQQKELESIVHELRSLPAETEWVEFKENDDNPEKIGQLISAISNMAALKGKLCGYVVWGIRNEDHEPVGTHFEPQRAKQGNQDLQLWLSKMTNAKVYFQFFDVIVNERRVVLLEIPRVMNSPTPFKNSEYVRVGSCLQELKDHPALERELWRMTNSSLRERFGVEEQNSAAISRVIKDSMETGLIRPYDVDQGRKFAKYVPFWA